MSFVTFRRTVTVAAAAAATATAVAFTAPVDAAPRPAPPVPSDMYCPLAAAHAGTGSGYPENTRGGFVWATRAGAQVLEMDVRFSRDGVPVVIHDWTLDRTTNGHGPVASQTYAQIAKATPDGMNRWWWAPYVPTLWQVLHDTAPATGRYLIELKVVPTDRQLDAFLGRLASTGVTARTTVASFYTEALAAVRARHVPGLRTGIITNPAWGQADPASVTAWGDSPIVYREQVDAGYVAALRAAGADEVWAWTVNDPQGWADMADAGVTGTVTALAPAYVRSACR